MRGAILFLFFLNRNIKFIRENRNLDVCVTDVRAKKVVVASVEE